MLAVLALFASQTWAGGFETLSKEEKDKQIQAAKDAMGPKMSEMDICRGFPLDQRSDSGDTYYTGNRNEWNGGFKGKSTLHGPNFRLRAMPVHIVPNSTFPWTNWEFDFQSREEAVGKCERWAVLRRPQGETLKEQQKHKSHRFQKQGYYNNDTTIHAYHKNLWMDLDLLKDRPGHAEVKFRCKQHCHEPHECTVGMHIGHVVGPVVGLRYVVKSHWYACPTDDPDQAQLFWRRNSYPVKPKGCLDVVLLAECAKGMWNGPCNNAVCCLKAWDGNCTGPKKEAYYGS